MWRLDPLPLLHLQDVDDVGASGGLAALRDLVALLAVDLAVIGHPFTSISKKHQNAFAEAINGVVDGKPLKDLKVDKVAGASWTSEAFNKALDVARQEASIQ